MLRRAKSAVTYANVTATIALFVALGGGAYALNLPKHSVGTKQLKAKSVTAPKIAKDAVTGAAVKESSLAKVPSAAKADSAATASNALALGGKEAAGYVSTVVVRSKALEPLANNAVVGGAGDGGKDDGTVQCPSGESAISGGARNVVSGKDQAIVSSRPTDATVAGVPADGTAASGWRTVVGDSGSEAADNPTEITVFVVCAS
jgi:hypothetical protein